MKTNWIFAAALGFVAIGGAEVSRAGEWVEPIVDFTTDGCTGYKEGPRREPNLWRHCCVQHDLFFWAGGTEAARDEADLALRDCVAATGHGGTARLMYAGVRLGKASPVKTKTGFWGGAWNARYSGYAKLTPAQAFGAMDAIVRRDRSGEVTSELREALNQALLRDLARVSGGRGSL